MVRSPKTDRAKPVMKHCKLLIERKISMKKAAMEKLKVMSPHWTSIDFDDVSH